MLEREPQVGHALRGKLRGLYSLRGWLLRSGGIIAGRFLARPSLRPRGAEEGVDLVERFGHALLHPHLDHLFHRLAVGEVGLD